MKGFLRVAVQAISGVCQAVGSFTGRGPGWWASVGLTQWSACSQPHPGPSPAAGPRWELQEKPRCPAPGSGLPDSPRVTRATRAGQAQGCRACSGSGHLPPLRQPQAYTDTPAQGRARSSPSSPFVVSQPQDWLPQPTYSGPQSLPLSREPVLWIPWLQSRGAAHPHSPAAHRYRGGCLPLTLLLPGLPAWFVPLLIQLGLPTEVHSGCER